MLGGLRAKVQIPLALDFSFSTESFGSSRKSIEEHFNSSCRQVERDEMPPGGISAVCISRMMLVLSKILKRNTSP